MLQEALTEATTEGKNSYSAHIPEMTVGGGVPIIGEFLGGNPECMLNPMGDVEIPVVTLAVNIGALCNVKARSMINRGVGILLLAHHLEMTGQAVQLLTYQGSCSQNSSSWFDCMTQIKAPDQPFDLHVLAYALVNPSFFRRHGFRIIESLPKPVVEEFRHGYGRTIDLSDIENDPTVVDVDWYIPEVKRNPTEYASVSSAIDHIENEARKAGILKD